MTRGSSTCLPCAPRSTNCELRLAEAQRLLSLEQSAAAGTPTTDYADADLYDGPGQRHGVIGGRRVEATGAQVQSREAEVARLRSELGALLARAGVADLAAFDAAERSLVSSFEQRARQVMAFMLDQNARIARGEQGRYSAGPGAGAQATELRAAAAALVHAAREVDGLERADVQATAESALGSEGPGGITHGLEHALPSSAQTVAARRRLENLRGVLFLAFPILAAPGVDLEAISTADEAALGRLVAGPAQHTLEAIETTRARPPSIWGLPPVMARTRELMGIEAGGGAAAVLDEHLVAIGEQAAADAAVTMALGIGLGIVAAVGTGGLSLLATVGGAAMSVHAAWHAYEADRQGSAAAGTALDPAQAISRDDPSRIWLAVAILGAVVDLGGAAVAFRSIAGAARAARALAEVETVVRAQARTLVTEGRLAATAEQDFVDRTLAAVRANTSLAGGAAAATGAVRPVTEILHSNAGVRAACDAFEHTPDIAALRAVLDRELSPQEAGAVLRDRFSLEIGASHRAADAHGSDLRRLLDAGVHADTTRAAFDPRSLDQFQALARRALGITTHAPGPPLADAVDQMFQYLRGTGRLHPLTVESITANAHAGRAGCPRAGRPPAARARAPTRSRAHAEHLGHRGPQLRRLAHLRRADLRPRGPRP